MNLFQHADTLNKPQNAAKLGGIEPQPEPIHEDALAKLERAAFTIKNLCYERDCYTDKQREQIVCAYRIAEILSNLDGDGRLDTTDFHREFMLQLKAQHVPYKEDAIENLLYAYKEYFGIDLGSNAFPADPFFMNCNCSSN